MPDLDEKGRTSKGKKKEPKKQTETDRVMGEMKAAREALERKASKPQAKAAPPAPKYIAQHKVVAGDTMSGLALKYYGSAVREKWMQIYEANKELIGDNPAFIKVGQTLNIPELSD
jgi:nucleoid-associated protein YgaU